MTNIPDKLKYTKSHEWIRVEGDIATIGISDHAQAELTDLVFVELPQTDRNVNAGEACAVVESVKTASDIYSPLTGTIIEVNSELDIDPGLVNSFPYTDGWIFKIKLTNVSELDTLMSSEDYKKQIEE